MKKIFLAILAFPILIILTGILYITALSILPIYETKTYAPGTYDLSNRLTLISGKFFKDLDEFKVYYVSIYSDLTEFNLTVEKQTPDEVIFRHLDERTMDDSISAIDEKYHLKKTLDGWSVVKVEVRTKCRIGRGSGFWGPGGCS